MRVGHFVLGTGAALCAAVAALAVWGQSSRELSTPKPVRASQITATFGVATHIDYTDGGYADISKVLGALDYLGVKRVRDHQPVLSGSDPVGQRHLHVAAEAGVQFVFGARAGNPPGEVVQILHEFVQAHPNSVIGIEGPNEVNNFPVDYKGLTGIAGAQAYQQDLYDLVQADPLLRNIPVLGFTSWPEAASASDWNNIHPYERQGDQPHGDLLAAWRAQDAADPGKPFAVTETGYHTSLTADTTGGWEGVDGATQAKFVVNTLMGAYELGSRGTFVYQLLDAYPGQGQEENFGLFDLAYNPKPAATAVRNLTSILADTGPNADSFTPTDLDVKLTGFDSKGHVVVSATSSGAYQVAAWVERDIWDENADKTIVNPADRVRFELGNSVFRRVDVYDPIISDKPIVTFDGSNSFSFDLKDHVLVFKFR